MSIALDIALVIIGMVMGTGIAFGGYVFGAAAGKDAEVVEIATCMRNTGATVSYPETSVDTGIAQDQPTDKRKPKEKK